MHPERLSPESESDKDILTQHISRYEFAKQYIKEKVVADIACGTGYGSRMLADGGANVVYGIDISEEAVAIAKQKYHNDKIEFLEGGTELLTTLPPAEIIVSFETIEHVNDPENFLKSLAGSISDEGKVIISTPIRQRGSLQDKPENPYHIREWNIDEFSDLLNQYFSQTEFLYQYIYRKLFYPGSRTVSKLLTKKFYPEVAKNIELSTVIKAPVSAGMIPITEGFVVAVCKK